ncbi:DUF4936 family protein [Niveibacterium sp.]|uniref:DUF4936 family protein n=1 Tax=Niveibacterium sp. TaxID=2017444 RepID=UPI0035B48094
MTAEIFIYYKVEATLADDAAIAATWLLDEVERRTGVRGSLMRRVDDPLTWMEEYRAVGDPVSLLRAVEKALQASELLSLLQGTRHIETFVLHRPAVSA